MRRTILLALTTGVAIGGVLGGLLATGAIGTDRSGEPPEKKAIEAAGAAAQATAEAGYHAPKQPDAVPPTAPQSCPLDLRGITTEVTGPIHPPPPSQIFDEMTLVAEGTAVAADGVPYSLFFGALKSDPQRGVLVVWRGVKDPCAQGSAPLGSDFDLVKYLTPLKGNPAKLTQIDGATVVFENADGQSGRFNYIGGTFSTDAAQ